MPTPRIKSRPTGLNHPVYKRAMGRIAKAHVWIYRRSNGRLLHRWRNGSALFRPVRSRVATAEEAAALWPRLDALYADFVNYRRWTDREIPVVVLEPR